MAKKELPVTGNGRTSGKKLSGAQVDVKSSSGASLTPKGAKRGMFGSKPKPAQAATPARHQLQPEHHPFFGHIFRKKK